LITIEKLRSYGADVSVGLSRCMGSEALYFKLVKMYVDDPSIKTLGSLLENGVYDKAFEEAHKLKGSALNLSLVPLSEPICTISDSLRVKAQCDYLKVYEEYINQVEKLRQLFD